MNLPPGATAAFLLLSQLAADPNVPVVEYRFDFERPSRPFGDESRGLKQFTVKHRPRHAMGLVVVHRNNRSTVMPGRTPDEAALAAVMLMSNSGRLVMTYLSQHILPTGHENVLFAAAYRGGGINTNINSAAATVIQAAARGMMGRRRVHRARFARAHRTGANATRGMGRAPRRG